MNTAFLQARITATETAIAAYEAAVLAIVSGGVQKYSLDTGQDKTDVTKLDIPKMEETLDKLYNRLCVFQARLNGDNTLLAYPGF